MVACTSVVALEGMRNSWLEILYVGRANSISRSVRFKDQERSQGWFQCYCSMQVEGTEMNWNELKWTEKNNGAVRFLFICCTVFVYWFACLFWGGLLNWFQTC